MDIILVPGMWLDGSSWDKVVPGLERAGHRPHPLTLPGLESKSADRSGVTLSDHIAAVVAAIDSCPGTEKVAVVGHSAAAGLAYAAVDARTDRIARAFFVGGFPAEDGTSLGAGFPAENREVALPDFAEFDDADVKDLTETQLEAFRQKAIPFPEMVLTEPLKLSDERRYDVPVTMICPEFSSETLKGWIDEDMEPVREIPRLHDVEYVDLPTGHWPQFTKPDELAVVIAERCN
ncbi:MAG: lipase family alpha/beta hydrolase [Acidimicrobiales bacterium]